MPIKIFRNSDQGAPVVNGQAGSLITALDAILVDGYGEVGISSMTRSGSTATVVTSSPHGLQEGNAALVIGANETEYNGEVQVSVVNGTTLTFAVDAGASTPATGSAMTIRRAPAGFSKTFADTNRACYRTLDMSGTRNTLYVDDNASGAQGGREAHIRAYEVMLDIDTGTGRAPAAAGGVSDRGYVWQKSRASNVDPRNWVMFTDGVTFYWFADPSTTTLDDPNNASSLFPVAFGDLIPTNPGDAYCGFISGEQTEGATNAGSAIFGIATYAYPASSYNSTFVTTRDYTGGLFPTFTQSYSGYGTRTLSYDSILPFPHPSDGGLYITPLYAVQGGSVSNLIRGRVPGIYNSMHRIPLPYGAKVDNIAGLPGVTLMAHKVRSGSDIGEAFIDISSDRWT